MKIKILSILSIVVSTLLFNVVAKADMCPNSKTITIKSCNDIENDPEYKTCIFTAGGKWEYPQKTEEKSIDNTKEKLKNNLYRLNKVEIANTKEPFVRCTYTSTDRFAKNLIFLRKYAKFIPSATSKWDQSKSTRFICDSPDVNECQFELAE